MPFRLSRCAWAGLIAAAFAASPNAHAITMMGRDGPKSDWDLSTFVWGGRGGYWVGFDGVGGSFGTVPAKIDWSEASARHFELSYTAETGALTFQIDVSGDGVFDKTERVSQTFTGYAEQSFRTMEVSIASSSNHRAWLRDLSINGASLGDLGDEKDGKGSVGFIQKDGSFHDILISGDLIHVPGDSRLDGRVSMSLRLGDAVPMSIPVSESGAVVEPASLLLLGLGAGGLVAIRHGRFRLRRTPEPAAA